MIPTFDHFNKKKEACDQNQKEGQVFKLFVLEFPL